jgi:hypothetical protein
MKDQYLENHCNFAPLIYTMDIQQQELQKAIEFVRQTFADKKINLDYSPASIKHLDTLFDNEFKDGKLRKPDSGFAKFQGLIMTGVSGYLAYTIIKNAGNSQFMADADDEKWFMNFKVTSATGLSVQPGLRVIKRMLQGEEMSLYAYALTSIKYLNPAAQLPVEIQDAGTSKKPWWKVW